ncbi:MAG: thiol peroxidase [Gammaproteobacteria bacterium]|jgi:thiol peroxidase|nr:thiol peroxidase [Gammaproteobacteria bacterium]
MAKVTLLGKPTTLIGDLPAVGSVAPGFLLTNAKLRDVGLKDFAGRKKVIGTVPSLDTGTCVAMTRAFDARAADRNDVSFLIVSADLPFAQGRVCNVEGMKNVQALSMMRGRQFAKDYGVLITDGPLAGVAARAVLVLDEDDRVMYTELVGEIDSEPDYDRAMAALN